MKARCLVTLAMTLLLVQFWSAAAAAAPYQSYTYNIHGHAVPAPQAYEPKFAVTGDSLQIGSLKEPQDIFVGKHGIYIVDTGNHRIIHLDHNWNVISVITKFDNNGTADAFKSPHGIYVTDDGNMYVADTENGRIVILEPNGSCVKTISVTKSDYDAFDQSFIFKPTKVAVSQLNVIYVISRNTYDGILTFDQEGTFRGFIGAPPVTPSLADIFWSMIATEEQRKRMALFLPVEYNYVTVDQEGYLYATEGNVLRRLSPTGNDLSRALGFWEPIGDINATPTSVFISVAPRDWGSYSVLDRNRGRVFTYDVDGNLLYVFGGIGNQLGLTQTPSAIAALGDSLLILDSRLGEVTVFEPTLYAQLIHSAIDAYNRGDYAGSADYWQQVLKLNANLDYAYSGIGRAQMLNGDFAAAMASYRLGNDRPGYSSAYNRYRHTMLAGSFSRIMTTAAIIFVVLHILTRLGLFARLRSRAKELKQKLMPREVAACRGDFRNLHVTGKRRLPVGIWMTFSGLYYSLHVISHPFDGFWDLKHEKRGNLGAAVILTALVSWTYIFMSQQTGFLFNYRDITNQNIYMDIASIVVPMLLWTVVNWALTTLMDGKGTLREIFITTAYALTPFVLVNIPLTIISNYITLDEGTFMYIARFISLFWSFTLLFFGTMVVHEYHLGKNILITGFTVAGIATVLFIGLLFFNVIDLMGAFVIVIYRELFMRV